MRDARSRAKSQADKSHGNQPPHAAAPHSHGVLAPGAAPPPAPLSPYEIVNSASAGTSRDAKSAMRGTSDATRTRCTARFGSQLWLAKRPTLPVCVGSIIVRHVPERECSRMTKM